MIAAPPACVHVASALYGDIDGDGRADGVMLRGRQCTVLVVRSRRGTYSIRLRRAIAGDPPPTIVKLAPLDRRPGREIVAAVDYGACSDWLHVFTFRRGHLVQMRIPGDGYFYEWACGSGLGSLDCLRPGVVFAWGMSSHGRPQHQTTAQIYRVRGTRFAFVRQRVIRIRYRANGATRFPGSLFSHCR